MQTSFTQSKVRNYEYYKGKDEARQIRACFHCAKPNHSYYGCMKKVDCEDDQAIKKKEECCKSY